MFLPYASTPPETRIYAIGDIHGRSDLLDALLALIERDWQTNPAGKRQIIFLGDYCDRGPDTSGVIDRLIELSADAANVFIRGNHDHYMIELAHDPESVVRNWLAYGGQQTAHSYGITEIWQDDPVAFHRAFLRAVPQRHRRFLEQTQLSHVEGDYFFVHAGVNPARPLDSQLPLELMWIRQQFLGFEGDLGKVVVHGHTPHEGVEVRPNRINVDTLAYDSGVLTAVVLEGNAHRFLYTA